VLHDLLADGVSCGLHRIERLMRLQALRARPRRRRLPPDLGERQATAVAVNVLDRSFEAAAPNRKWIADFTYVLCLILRRRATGTDGRPLPSGAPTAAAHRWALGFARPANRLPAPDCA
jgi:transposase InsO family protein